MNFGTLGKWVTQQANALGVGGIKDFPYEIGDVQTWETSIATHWTQRKGKRRADGLDVTIFEFQKKEGQQDQLDLAMNGWRKTKTLMMPGFLKCYDAVDTPQALYIATEECTPLKEVLANDELTQAETRGEFVAFGLYSVIKALALLHERNLFHGNCNLDSIYCSKAGDWKLWGVDWVTNLNDPESSSHFKNFSGYLPGGYKSPELAKENWQLIEKSPAHATDAWSLAALMYEVFNEQVVGDEPLAPQDLKQRGSIPSSLYQSYVGLLATAPKARVDPAKLLTQCDYFADNVFIATQQEIDELQLKDQVDRDNFFRRLAAAVDAFPIANCKYTILPKLTTALSYGAGGATALEPILKIGSKMSEADFATLVVPGVTQLFNAPEPLVRIKLLQNVNSYASLIPQPVLCEQIWPPLSQGFQSKVPEIRELTIRSMVAIMPRLNAALQEEAQSSLLKMQMDPAGVIRTNATICLGMVAAHLPAGDRAQTLHKAFSRMLRDSFPLSRSAAASGYISSIDHFDFKVAATAVLPVLCPALVDPEVDVRTKAAQAVKQYMQKVEQGQAAMPATAQAPQGAAPAKPSAGTPAADDRGSAAEGSSGNSPLGGMMSSWASSALSALQKPSASTPAKPAAAPAAVPAAAADDDEGWGDDNDMMDDPAPTPPARTTPAVRKPVASSNSLDAAGSTGNSGGWGDDDGFGSDDNAPAAAVKPAASIAAEPKKPGVGIGGLKMAKPKKKGLGGAKKMD